MSLLLISCLLPTWALGLEESEPLYLSVEDGNLEKGGESEDKFEARYKTTQNGDWVYGILSDACAQVYLGGSVEVLRDIELTEGVIINQPLTLISADPDHPCKITYTSESEHDRFLLTTKANVTLKDLILDGGRLEGRTTHTELVGVQNGQLLLGSGAVLQNNDNVDTAKGGGGLRVVGGTAIMSKASVIRNCRGVAGGGAAVTGSNSMLVLMDDSVIEDCQAFIGGGIFIQEKGKMILQGNFTIRNNQAKEHMEGMSYGFVDPAGSGGGIFVENSSGVQMQNGSITGNTAESTGGGMYVDLGLIMLMSGEVTKNHAGSYGGGVMVSYRASVMVGGSPRVTGNSSGLKYFENMYLDGAEDTDTEHTTRPVFMGAPMTENACIGISRRVKPDAKTPSRVVVSPNSSTNIKVSDLVQFYSDDPGYTLLLEGKNIVLSVADVVFDNQGHGERPIGQHLDNNQHFVTDPGDLSERGYDFGGWFQDKACTKSWDFEQDTITKFDEEKPLLTLYAKWELIHYNITYDLKEGGKNAEGNPEEYTVESGDITLKEPTREGYRFLGWEETSIPPDIPAGSIEDKHFTAQWEELPTYTVTYTDNANGSAFTDQEYDKLYEGDATPVFDGGTPKRHGYIFTGWFPEFSENVSGNITYTAKWEKDNPDPNPGPTSGSGVGPGTKPLPKPDPEPEIPLPKPDPEPETLPYTPPALESTEHFAYITGYPDGMMRPEAAISRAEVAVIFFRLMTDAFRTEYWAVSSSFHDVASSDWYNNAVSTSVNAGLIYGFPDGTFGGEQPITRAEFAAIAARFLSEETALDSGFLELAGHWSKNYVNRAVAAGWIKGFLDNTFRPENYITRAQVVTLVNRMLARSPSAEAMLPGMIHWPDNPKTAWYYADVQEATNGHTYERDGEYGPESWTGLLKNRDWTELER